MNACKIIFSNQKGGVGKTTSALNVGASLAKMGKKVLLVDFDPQGNLTSAINGDPNTNAIYNVVIGDVPCRDAYQKTMIENLYLIPGNVNTAGLNYELVDEEDREYFLTKALAGIESEWDFILVDCPPSLGLISMNAMAWTTNVIIPLQCEYLAMEGLNSLVRSVANVKKSINSSIKIMGILFTMYTARTKLANEVVEDVTEFFKGRVFDTKIPRNVRLGESPSYGMPITVYDGSSKGSKAYVALAKEVIERAARN